jgi:lipopolysaccharide transport system ATP-binding protein
VQNAFWALDDVSFEIEKGEAVGIIGRNGAGKSTLLKVLSRITRPTRGCVSIFGRVGSLLEVGTGFHPELTGRENIYLNGAILGMGRKEIARKFDEIVAFAEVEKFLDTQVKFYSSGMYVRLAFAVAAHLEPEILLVDEVLAVGDAQFQKKSLGKMGEVVQGGRTVLFVSHNMAAVNSICDRAILLDKGTVVLDDVAAKVTTHYLSQDISNHVHRVVFEPDEALGAQILEAELADKPADEGTEMVSFRCKYAIRKPLENILLCVDVQNLLGTSVFYSNDERLLDARKRKPGIHDVELQIPKHLLAPGTYSVAFGFWEPGRAPEHFPKERLSFQRATPNDRLAVHGISWPSVIYMPATWKYISTPLEEKHA